MPDTVNPSNSETKKYDPAQPDHEFKQIDWISAYKSEISETNQKGLCLGLSTTYIMDHVNNKDNANNEQRLEEGKKPRESFVDKILQKLNAKKLANDYQEKLSNDNKSKLSEGDRESYETALYLENKVTGNFHSRMISYHEFLNNNSSNVLKKTEYINNDVEYNEQKIQPPGFLQKLSEDKKQSDGLLVHFRGEKNGHAIAVVTIKDKQNKVTGYKVFDSNKGEHIFNDPDLKKNQENLNTQVSYYENLYTPKWGPFRPLTVEDTSSMIRELNMSKQKNDEQAQYSKTDKYLEGKLLEESSEEYRYENGGTKKTGKPAKQIILEHDWIGAKLENRKDLEFKKLNDEFKKNKESNIQNKKDIDELFNSKLKPKVVEKIYKNQEEVISINERQIELLEKFKAIIIKNLNEKIKSHENDIKQNLENPSSSQKKIQMLEGDIENFNKTYNDDISKVEEDTKKYKNYVSKSIKDRKKFNVFKKIFSKSKTSSTSDIKKLEFHLENEKQIELKDKSIFDKLQEDKSPSNEHKLRITNEILTSRTRQIKILKELEMKSKSGKEKKKYKSVISELEDGNKAYEHLKKPLEILTRIENLDKKQLEIQKENDKIYTSYNSYPQQNAEKLVNNSNIIIDLSTQKVIALKKLTEIVNSEDKEKYNKQIEDIEKFREDYKSYKKSYEDTVIPPLRHDEIKQNYIRDESFRKLSDNLDQLRRNEFEKKKVTEKIYTSPSTSSLDDAKKHIDNCNAIIDLNNQKIEILRQLSGIKEVSDNDKEKYKDDIKDIEKFREDYKIYKKPFEDKVTPPLEHDEVKKLYSGNIEFTKLDENLEKVRQKEFENKRAIEEIENSKDGKLLSNVERKISHFSSIEILHEDKIKILRDMIKILPSDYEGQYHKDIEKIEKLKQGAKKRREPLEKWVKQQRAAAPQADVSKSEQPAQAVDHAQKSIERTNSSSIIDPQQPKQEQTQNNVKLEDLGRSKEMSEIRRTLSSSGIKHEQSTKDDAQAPRAPSPVSAKPKSEPKGQSH